MSLKETDQRRSGDCGGSGEKKEEEKKEEERGNEERENEERKGRVK